MDISYADLLWSTDFTYIPLPTGFMYLVAVIDWYSCYVLSWEPSNTMDYLFCVSALQAALTQGEPGIFNTDQGSQFTTNAFTRHLLDRQILISMDGRGPHEYAREKESFVIGEVVEVWLLRKGQY